MDCRLWYDQARSFAFEPDGPIAPALLGSDPHVALAHALWTRPVRSQRHDRVASALTDDLVTSGYRLPGARTIVSLSAPFGSGKSVLIKRWGQQITRDRLGELGGEPPTWSPIPGYRAEIVPVCYLTLQANTVGTDLYRQLLGFLGHPVDGKVSLLPTRAVTALQRHQVRLIVIDDAHMLRTESATGRTTLNAVKHLNTELGELGGVMVVVGAGLTGGDLLNDPQIRVRLSAHELEPYGAADDRERTEWAGLMLQFEKRVLPHLPHNSNGDLTRTLAGLIWERTQGWVGDTAAVIYAATIRAATENRPLDRQMILQARPSQRALDGYQPPPPASRMSKASTPSSASKAGSGA